MTCDQVQPLLEAFTDRTLGRGTAWRVRRHLAACPACASELAGTRLLNSRVRLWRDVSAPAGLQSRIAAALPSSPPVAVPRRPLVVRRAALGLAGAAAASAAFFWLVPGQPGQPTIAYADVEQAMQQVRTATWEETMMFYDRAGHPVKRSASHFTKWVRRSPPALASLGQFQDLSDARGELLRISPNHYATFQSHVRRGGSIATMVEATIREITQPQIGGGLLGAVGTNQIKFSPTQQKHTMLDGQDCILFTRDQEIVAAPRHGPDAHYFFHIKAWADPITRRVVRIEQHSHEGQDKAGPDFMVLTRSNFSYNQSPPPGVFDWSPPPGAKMYNEMEAFDAMLFHTRHPAAPASP